VDKDAISKHVARGIQALREDDQRRLRRLATPGSWLSSGPGSRRVCESQVAGPDESQDR
jgi:hypothetical protein